VDQYNSEMTFRGDTVDGDQAVVRTTLLLNKGAEMALDYRMHHPRDRWQVYDLNIDGISLVANYRAQFNKIVRTSSYEALVTALKSRQAEFSVPATAASGAKSVR
jgi:phospholipid transport system substrate-binding protein